MQKIPLARLSALLALAFVCASTPSRAWAGTPFDGCGTIVPGVTCPKLFQADAGGLYVLETNLASWQVGDYVHVNGLVNPGCITICQQGNGCIVVNTIAFCGTGTPMCFGDGSAGACPCSNNGTSGHGCKNSAGTGGALLDASGTTQPDALVLTSSGELPTALSIFLQGDALAPAPIVFGDGLRCVAGALLRIATRNASGGTVSYPGPGDPSISQQSATLGDPIPAGATRWYQVYYRDPDLSFCPAPTGNSWNVSNGQEIVW